MAESPDMQIILNALAAVSEDLAVELLSTTVEDEDMSEYQRVIHHLNLAASLLTKNQIDAPYAVREIIRHYTEQQGSLPIQQ
jgi:hypothetical protein